MPGIKEVKLTDLAFDDSFFDDLRCGKYVLVLGAGFSWGIPNKAGKTIPTGRGFVDCSNKKFKVDIDQGDYNSAANRWLQYIEGETKTPTEKAKRFNEFKNLFLVNEEKFSNKKKLYANILLPKWNHIYTFNFDNVLNVLIEDRVNDFEILYYEPGSFSPEKKDGIGYLHNSILKADSINDLVFTNDQYGVKIHDKAKDNHLYYALLNDIKAHNKNLIIIGCQFNEQSVYSYLFNTDKGIREDLKIINVNLDDKPQYGFNIEQILHDSNWINCSAVDFLQFLNDNKSKIENISIAGAELIDNAFIKKKTSIGNDEKYTAEDFYLAKQASDCQWFGVIRGWDVERHIYATIIREVSESFEIGNKKREPKIIARVLGRGGTGKSTLLRKLAIDLANKTFAVIWVNNKEIDNFFDQGIKQFSGYPDKMFLVIIEDWYQIKNRREIITNLCNYSNIRIILGDRVSDNSISREHLYEPERNLFKLDVDPRKNQETIDKILDKIRAWRPIAGELLKSHNDYKSSLYLILWTIGRTYQLTSKTESSSKFSKGELIGHFQSIVESDLRGIEKDFPGYAKALYYLAMVYKTNKIYIGFDAFEKIANSFKGTERDCAYALLPDHVKRLLEIYINKSIGDRKAAGALPLIAFNHDILAEEGIASIEMRPPFGDLIKVKMLDVIINDGDAFSASSFLSYFLHTTNVEAVTNDKKAVYINTLYDKENRGTYLNHIFYPNGIFPLNERKNHAEKFINGFINNEDFAASTISLSIKELGFTDKSGISEKQLISLYMNGKEMFQGIISNCLTNLRETPDKGEKQAEHLIKLYINGEEIEHAIISNCLANLRETLGKGEKQAKDLIKLYINGKEMFHAIISNCLANLRETSGKGEKQTKHLIKLYVKGEEINGNPIACEIISSCFTNLKETAKKGETSARKLIGLYVKGEEINGNPIARDIICRCFTNLKETAKKGETSARKLIGFYIKGKEINGNPIAWEIICRCFTNLKETAEKGETSARTLISLYLNGEAINGNPIAPEIISSCFTNLKETAEKGETSARVLIDRYINGEQIFGKSINDGIICSCLSNLKETAHKGAEQAIKITDLYVESKKIGGKKIWDGVISNCLINLRNTAAGVNYAKSFLENKNWKKENWSVVYQSLYCFSSLPLVPAFIGDIVLTIINDNSDKINKESARYFRNLNLMGIPFHQIPEWERESNKIISNFHRNHYRSLITKVLYSYRSKPREIKLPCKYILENWRTEIQIPIPQGQKNGKEKKPHFGDHIKIALGHPALTALEKITAEEIIAERSIHIPYDLFKIAEKIVYGNYNGWDLKSSDEPSPEETE